MYEIDPLVARIATDSRRFTFLSRCLPDARIRLGDARVTLEQEPAGSADVLVIDAFSSDSIPVHLLTAEAFEVYRRHLSANGLLLIHISNKYLDLEPVLAAAAANGRWHSAGRFYRTSEQDRVLNYNGSHWIAMSPSFATMQKLTGASPEPWEPLSGGGIRWTDDHASLLSVIGR
jgi:spermidine synthase